MRLRRERPDNTTTFVIPIDLAEFGGNWTRVDSVNLCQHVIQKLPLVHKNAGNAFVPMLCEVAQCDGDIRQSGALGFNSIPDSFEDPLNQIWRLGLFFHIAKLVYGIENAGMTKFFVKLLNDGTHGFDAEHALPD